MCAIEELGVKYADFVLAHDKTARHVSTEKTNAVTDNKEFLNFLHSGAIGLCSENSDLVSDIINED